jgi:hypothetical protein
MVPTGLLVTAMAGGFAVAVTAVLGVVTVLGHRIGDVHSEVQSLRSDVGRRFEGVDRSLADVRDEMVTIRASLGAIDARLSTLEDR